jgi:hypothetical protein
MSEKKEEEGPEEEGPEEEGEKYPEEIRRMSKEELATFVREFRGGQIFSSAHISEGDDHIIRMVFLVLTLGGLHDAPDSYLNSIGLIWEYFSNAGPRSINGYPQFFSCHLMHRDDWDRARKAIIELDNREKSDVERLLDDSVTEPEEPSP